MRTSRQVAEKLGTVRQDPDLDGLLFTLISRATGDCQERAARACCHLATRQGRGLSKASLDRESAPRRTLRHTAHTRNSFSAHHTQTEVKGRKEKGSEKRGPRTAERGLGCRVSRAPLENGETRDPPRPTIPTGTNQHHRPRCCAHLSLSINK